MPGAMEEPEILILENNLDNYKTNLHNKIHIHGDVKASANLSETAKLSNYMNLTHQWHDSSLVPPRP